MRGAALLAAALSCAPMLACVNGYELHKMRVKELRAILAQRGADCPVRVLGRREGRGQKMRESCFACCARGQITGSVPSAPEPQTQPLERSHEGEPAAAV